MDPTKCPYGRGITVYFPSLPKKNNPCLSNFFTKTNRSIKQIYTGPFQFEYTNSNELERRILQLPSKSSSCQQLAQIIGGQVITSSPVCVVQRLRNFKATILCRRTRSPLALPFALSFENNKHERLKMD